MTRPHMIDRSHRYEGPLPDPRVVPDDREPTNPAIFLAVMAVMIIGLSLCASVMP